LKRILKHILKRILKGSSNKEGKSKKDEMLKVPGVKTREKRSSRRTDEGKWTAQKAHMIKSQPGHA
jgi:hypothetical protein